MAHRDVDDAGMADRTSERARTLPMILTAGGALVLGLLSGPIGTGVGSLFWAASVVWYVSRARKATAPPRRQPDASSETQLRGRLRQLGDALPEPILLLDEEARVRLHNRAAREMFGADLTGLPIVNIARAPQALEVLRTVTDTGRPAEAEYAIHGARTKHFLFYAAPLEGVLGRSGTLILVRERTAQKQLERTRTDFVANAGHELRTPLTAMSGMIETLQHHAKDDPQARETFLEMMAQQATRMLRLIEDLTNLSSIELKEYTRPTQAVDLAVIVGTAEKTLAPQQRLKSFSLHTEVDGEHFPVRGDSEELLRVLTNLCENARKYGAPAVGGKAEVTVRLRRGVPAIRQGAHHTGDTPEQIAVRAGCAVSGLVCCQVIDRGQGIRSADLPLLTERFYRGDPELSRQKGGTGLGLAIVKHILNRHRSGLRIESVPGEGATFTLFLPPAENV